MRFALHGIISASGFRVWAFVCGLGGLGFEVEGREPQC